MSSTSGGDAAAGASASRVPSGTTPLDVRLQVADIDRSVRFYTGVIGLRLIDAGADEAALAAGRGAPPLVRLVQRRGTRFVAPHSRLGLYHFAILLPTRAALGRCLQHLADQGRRVASADHLVSEALYLSDPDGLGIELYADRPRADWPRENGRVRMATMRLDLRDLAHAGRDMAWNGLPPGTALGHVHLHVGDIDTARRFYGVDGLGLDTTVEMPGALFVAAGGYHHHLGLNTWAEGAPAPDADDAHLLEWRLSIPESSPATASAARLAALGHDVRPTDDGWTVRDPWGTALHVVAPTNAP